MSSDGERLAAKQAVEEYREQARLRALADWEINSKALGAKLAEKRQQMVSAKEAVALAQKRLAERKAFLDRAEKEFSDAKKEFADAAPDGLMTAAEAAARFAK